MSAANQIFNTEIEKITFFEIIIIDQELCRKTRMIP